MASRKRLVISNFKIMSVRIYLDWALGAAIVKECLY